MKGFTLIEAMVAVSILAISVAAPTYGASRALVAAQNSNNQLTASYLAQEGIEYVRLLRDSSYLSERVSGAAGASGVAWTNFKTDIQSCRTNTGCSLDPLTPNSPFAVCGATCPIYLKSTGEYTTQSAGNSATIFTRTIKVSDTASSDELSVKSTVSWEVHGRPYKVEIVNNLTRWQL